jgi:hypothetical protein
MRSVRAASLFVSATLFGAGCNDYELFRVSGFAQESFSNQADVLFVVDNSSSMQDESLALALNFNVFIRNLVDGQTYGQDGLTDAVGNYISYSQNKESVVDYQLAITSTDVAVSYGSVYGDPPLLNRGTPNLVTAFNKNLLCSKAAYLRKSDVPSDPSFQCTENPEPQNGEISQEYLTCLCGGSGWENTGTGGNEEHLEAIYMAMCRAVENPPEACFDTVNQFTEADVMSNEGLLRDNSTLIPIVVTDEGDTSRRMGTGDGEPNEYAELFAQFNHRMTFAVIGPTTERCNSGSATTWGVERFQWFVNDTGGRYFNIAEPDASGNCGITDFSVAMEQLGQLLNSLDDTFPLQGVPDIDSIRVFVDGDGVPKATEEVDTAAGTVTYGNGWSYLPAENAIAFHGDAIPGYEADVRIYYLPLEGMPRELPF